MRVHTVRNHANLQQALQLQPDDPASASLYGAVCTELDDASVALGPLKAAMKREPSWVALPQQLDHVYTAMDQLSDAIVYAKQAFRLARRFREVSTSDNYSYFESGVTMRWVSKDDLFRLRYRAARRA